MSTHCSKCGDLIFDEDGQAYGTYYNTLTGDFWLCDNCDADGDPSDDIVDYITELAIEDMEEINE